MIIWIKPIKCKDLQIGKIISQVKMIAPPLEVGSNGLNVLISITNNQVPFNYMLHLVQVIVHVLTIEIIQNRSHLNNE